jgi:subtilisin family serine protease
MRKGVKVWGLIVALVIFTSVFAAMAAPDFESEDISSAGVPDAYTQIWAVEKNSSAIGYESGGYSSSNIPEAPEFVPGEVIVKFKQNVGFTLAQQTDGVVTTGISSIDTLNKRYGVTSQAKVFETAEKPVSAEIPDLTNIYILTLPQDADIISIIKEYQKDQNVEYAEPNYIRKTCAIPNDPYYSQQWAHQNMQSEQAWDIEKGNSNVVIAIIDSGVDWNHPDLAANIWSNSGEIAGNGIDDDGNGYIDDIRGWDFVDTTNPYCTDIDCTDRDNDPMDNDGHGTHCAGIAGAVTDNGVGVAGMAWDCKIMALRSGYATEFGSVNDIDAIAKAIYYAANNSANVISMSFGGSFLSKLERDAMNYAYDEGVILVGGAGNSNTNKRHYPAASDNVIAVSATDSSETKVGFSNYGSWVDVAAPGLDIKSTYFDDTYITTDGTSMSCPYVAGLVGLILSNNPGFTQEEVKSILHSTTDPVTSSEYIGIGRINAYKAIQVDSIPIANLNSSLDDINVYGTIDITGTASGDNFQNYTLEYGVGNYPTSWTEITSSTTPVTNGVLATWSAIPGTFSIRLRVTDTTGQTSEDRVVINPRTKLYLCNPGQYLSEDPNTEYYYITPISSGYKSWDDYFLTGDINGTSYSYCLDLASASSTTFKIEIIIDGTTVANDTITVPYDPYYRQFCNELTGLDPTTSDGDEVIFKITKVSGGNGGVLYGAGIDSHIKIPPTVLPLIKEKGDFNSDGVINWDDFLLFADTYGTAVGDANYDVLADFDNDGDVDWDDFLMFADVYGT